MNNLCNRFIIAGTHSGAGKTTVALGLMDLFSRRGFKVQPFKVGPDFIDPSLHSLLTGKISRNLDSFLLKPEIIQTLFSKSSRTAEISVIEGVGGLFDGYSGKDSRGSTSDIAKILSVPVILVCDAKSSARSIAAVVKGFQEFDKSIKIAGVFLNRLANEKHLQWCKEAIEKKCRVPVIGYLFSSANLMMKERHLGLIPAAEKKFAPRWIAELRKQMDAQVNWQKMLQLDSPLEKGCPVLSHTPAYSPASSAGSPPTEVGGYNIATPLHRGESKGWTGYFKGGSGKGVRIGIAKDSAFSFYYQDNLDLLESLGVELVPFSPIQDAHLPQGLDGIYFGGGFPELYAEALQENKSIRKEIFTAVQAGMPVYAECGGLMYMGRTLMDFRHKKFQMVGALPFRTEMTKKISLAYVTCKIQKNNLLGKKGEAFPGQFFHFSKLLPEKKLTNSYILSNGSEQFEDGAIFKNLLASYVHLHFWSKITLAKNFVKKCRQWKKLND